MEKLYIITGANGFLGNNIIRKLNEDGITNIRAFVLQNSDVQALDNLICEVYYGDVTSFDSLNEVFLNVSNYEVYVIHCAAIVSIKTKHDNLVNLVNVRGTINIVQKVLEIKAKLIYVSSVHAIIEKPKKEVITETTYFDSSKVRGLYAKSKAEAAKYVLENVNQKGLNACILHPSGIIGPNDYGPSHLTQLVIDSMRGKLKACVNGGYDFVDVRDVANGVINACYYGKAGECYILSNQYYKIKKIVDLVSKHAKVKRISYIMPMWLAKLTAPLSELYYKTLKQPPLYTSYSLYTLTSNSNFSHKKATNELHYTTRSMDDTIKDTIAWIKEHHMQKSKIKYKMNSK